MVISKCVWKRVQQHTKLIQRVSTVSLFKKREGEREREKKRERKSKVSYKILLLSDSIFFELFFHIFATITEALIVVGHKFMYTLLTECSSLRC
jgi:heme/copper-type cytochrome/quinol oxidase subunit 3